jgi:pimeloyl-ACP methyl ester carboxylesterase
MPVLSIPGVKIDYTDEGQGRPVVLIHSSVSGNRQWRALTDALSDRYRVLAPNLYGYGETSPWPGEAPQTLHAQARLIAAVCEEVGDPVHLVGHSFGGSVALTAAALLDSRVGGLVLLEPNPFALLKHGGRTSAFLETQALRDHMQRCVALNDWTSAAERFADYWLGDGAWSAMPEKRRAAFSESLPPVFHEWEAAMDEQTTVEQFRALPCRTLVVSDRATRPPIREIVDVLEQACPHWSFRAIAEGGHMAPLTRPELVNPIVRQFLDAG